MIKLATIIFSILVQQTLISQTVDWRKSDNWRLYAINDDRALHFSIDTLRHFASISLNQDTMQYFLSRASMWPKEDFSMWMGVFVATCKLNGKDERKVSISVYGGFFYDHNTRRYYQVDKDVRQDWLDFFNENLERVMRE
jgi:hypothetical protein